MTNIGCINTASHIIGQKWTALIIREIAKGPQRYCEIERGVPGINPRILTQRLDSLQSQGIITECDNRYELTRKGHDLLPILKDMASWSAKYPRDSSWNVA